MDSSEILLYQTEDGLTRIEVTLENETVWLNQTQLTELFQTTKQNVSLHIKNIFGEGELDENSVVKDYLTTAADGKQYKTKYYNLDVIISVGYRVKSHRGTQFRIWATQRLKELIVKGFTLDDERLKQAGKMNYFDELLERVRDIRSSEKVFYQKIKDIYCTSIDYDKDAAMTREFFQVIQNKLHHAVHNRTAAELITERANHNKPNMGLTSWRSKNIRKDDVLIAKNYLTEDELKQLNLLVEQYLAFAESRALTKRPMYMKDWIAKLDDILQINDREILRDAGKITRKLADETAGKEFEKFKEKQRRIEGDESLAELENEIKQLAGKPKK